MADLADWEWLVQGVTGNQDLPDWTLAVSGSTSGGGGPPNPGLPNLVLQFDSSRLTGTDGSLLSSWAPTVGDSSYTLIQATGANQPTLYTTTAAKLVNGNPAVWFSGNQWMRPTGPAALAQPLTVYAIMGRTGATDPQVYFDGTGASTRTLVYFDAGHYHGGLVTTASDLGLADTTGTHFVCLSDPYPANTTFYADGNSQAGPAYPAGSPVPFTFGADYTNAAQLTGFICEVGVYSTALSAADVATVRFYAQNKWGTP